MIPVEGRIEGAVGILWGWQGDILTDAARRYRAHRVLGEARCRPCGAVLAVALELNEDDGAGGFRPFLDVVVKLAPIANGATLINDAGTFENMTFRSPGFPGVEGRLAGGAVMALYGALVPDRPELTGQPIEVECAHHGARGTVMASQILDGRTVRV